MPVAGGAHSRLSPGQQWLLGLRSMEPGAWASSRVGDRVTPQGCMVDCPVPALPLLSVAASFIAWQGSALPEAPGGCCHRLCRTQYPLLLSRDDYMRRQGNKIMKIPVLPTAVCPLLVAVFHCIYNPLHPSPATVSGLIY